MRSLKFYRHGLTMGTPPVINNHDRVKRSTISGWSPSSTRSNTQFLRSVDERYLPATSDAEVLVGFSVTLTVKNCPTSHTQWKTFRDIYLKRLKRLGLYRYHWLTEWQRRAVPHLHLALWFISSDDDFGLMRTISSAWIEITSSCKSNVRSQFVAEIYDSVGWFKYLSKHASRGVYNYQRSSASIPSGWAVTGRMWGYGGHWVSAGSTKLNVTDNLFFSFRRIIRSWRVADARSSRNWSRLVYARQMLSNSDPALSAVLGQSEWMDYPTAVLIYNFLAKTFMYEQIGVDDDRRNRR